jgi:hypothetical protein
MSAIKLIPFAVVPDYGTNQSGIYDLIDRSGNVIATVSQPGFVTSVSPQGTGVAPLVTVTPATNAQVRFEQTVVGQVFQTLTSPTNPANPNNQNNPNNPNNQNNNNQNNPQQQPQTQNSSPQSTSSSSGSSTPPSDLPTTSSPTPTTPPPPPAPPVVTAPIQPTPTPQPPAQPPPPPIQPPVILTQSTTPGWSGGSGNWNNAANWSDQFKPGLNDSVTIAPTTPVTVTVDDAEQTASLMLAANNTLQIVNNPGGGASSLTLTGSVDT